MILIALMVLPRNAAALTATCAAGVWVVTLAIARWRDLRLPGHATGAVLTAAAAPVAWIAARSLWAADPHVAFGGSLGQRTGVFTWVAALAVLVIMVLARRSGDAGRMVRSLAVFGSALAMAAIIDRMGLLPGAKFSIEPSGVVENSISLAQVLLVCLGAALSWLWAKRHSRQAVAAGACVLVILAGLLVADSAAAWVGAALAVVAGLALTLMVRMRMAAPSSSAWAYVTSGVLVGSVATIAAMLRDGISPGMEANLAQLANNRFTIWTSAVAQVQERLLFGWGAEQFSAWVTWSVSPEGAVLTNGTYDPHNVLLYWLLAGGMVAFVLVVVATAMLVSRLASSVTGVSGGLAASGVLALGTAMLFAWTSPLGLILAAALVGVMLPTDSIRPAPSLARGLAIASASLALGGIVLTLSWSGLAEFTWARLASAGSADATEISRLARSTGDPSLASQAVLIWSARTGTESPLTIADAVAPLTPVLDRAAQWHVDAAFGRFRLAASDLGADAEWTSAKAALQAGTQADPTSGLWDYLGASAAALTGRVQEARQYAVKALRLPLPDAARAQMEELL